MTHQITWLAIVLATLGPPSRAVGQVVTQQEATSRVTAVTGVTIVPMDAERLVPDQTVLIDQGRIAALGPDGAVVVPRGALQIDGTGKYVMPGLFDMHVHFRELEAEQYLALYLAHGVTTVQSMNGTPFQLELRRRVASGAVGGPRIFTTGPTTSTVGLSTPEEATRLVFEQRDAGYDAIKQYGVGSATPRETYRQLMETARAEGVRVVGHAPRNLPFDEVLAAQQHSIDHMEEIVYTHTPIVERFQPHLDIQFGRIAFDPADAGSLEMPALEPLDEVIAELARDLRGAGVAVTPTLVAFGTIAATPSPRFVAMLDAPALAFMHPLTRINWGPGLNRYRTGGWADKLELMAKILRASHDLQMRMTAAFNHAGVPLMTGTDASLPLVVPGVSLHDELRLFVESGLTPYEALRAATVTPATFLDIDDDVGTIAVGKRADLLLLNANPLNDVANANDIAGVWANGVWRTRDALDGTLEAIAAHYRVLDQQLAPLSRAIADGDPDATLAAFVDMERGNDAVAELVEAVVNAIGYRYMRADDTDEALRVFILNTKAFPRAWNTWDSLAEAYMVRGDDHRAIQYYNKSLELNPANDNARQMLNRIKSR